MTGAALLFLAVLPLEDVTRDRVDHVELNHFHDETGRRVFDQIVFWDWQPLTSRYQVRAWRLLKTEGQVPLKDWRAGDYQLIWWDGEVFRHVRATTREESWTQYDPESHDRDQLPESLRRGLAKPIQPRNDRE